MIITNPHSIINIYEIEQSSIEWIVKKLENIAESEDELENSEDN